MSMGTWLGFRRFARYRIRALLYAGRPNWDLLRTSLRTPLKSDEPGKPVSAPHPAEQDPGPFTEP